MILATERLCLRPMTQDDFDALYGILGDRETMYAYEHAFSTDEAQLWLDKQRGNYTRYGYGLWAVVHKISGEMIGQCGLTRQFCGDWGEVLEIGYLFNRNFWHHGFATEAAVGCKQYAFNNLHASEVFSIIRDSNIPSRRVSQRNGMRRRGSVVKHYYGIDMPHYVYSISRTDFLKESGREQENTCMLNYSQNTAFTKR